MQGVDVRSAVTGEFMVYKWERREECGSGARDVAEGGEEIGEEEVQEEGYGEDEEESSEDGGIKVGGWKRHFGCVPGDL